MTLKHAKTVTVADWTQADLDAYIAAGQFAPGTTLADIMLQSDWNDDHVFPSGTEGAILHLGATGEIEESANFLYDSANQRQRIGANVVGAPDGGLYLTRSLTGLGNAHGFGDESAFSRSNGSINSFDAAVTVTAIGTTGGSHYAGFQCRPIIDIATTLPELRGYHFAGATELKGGGTITEVFAFNSSGITITSGTVTNYYGFYQASVTGPTNVYGLYLAGSPTNLMGGGFTGFGTTAPTARIHTAGNMSAAAWTTAGINMRVQSATYTDTSSSGTVTANYINSISGGTIAASSATTYTAASTVWISPPSAGTNATITTPYSLITTGNCRFGAYVGIGSNTTPTSCLHIGTNQSAASWTTQGLLFHVGGQTLTDTSGSGTIASRMSTSIHGGTFASSSAVTVTNGATLYIEAAPANGSNTTITNPWSVWVDAGNIRLDGSMAIGVTTTPTARLHLGAGTATASTAPLKFTSGTNLTTAEAGAMEYNGTNLFFTRSGTTRETMFVGVDGATAPTTTVGAAIVNFYGSSATNFLGTPNSWASVVIAGTTYKMPLYT